MIATFAILILLLVAGGGFFIVSLPILTGFAAKNLCSCVFVAGRSERSVIEQDLNFFPVSLARSKVDYQERSVISSIFGLARQKAIFREGLGCTLVRKHPEEEIRRQVFRPTAILLDNPEEIPWPQGDLLSAPPIPDIDKPRLQRAVEAAFDPSGSRPDKRTRAVVVVYKNQLVTEKYAEGFDRNTPQLGWSMSKSITNALIGILVKQGRLDIDAPAPIEAWQKDERKNISLKNLLQMSSGLKWREVYTDLSNVTRMLYKSGDIFTYALNRPFAHKPDSFWLYSSGTTNILSGIIRQTIGNQEDYLAFPREALFNKIGMRSAIMESDASGNLVGSSYTFATPRDWARFGLLYLNDGVWNGERILPEGWVRFSATPADASGGEYGAQFWLNRSGMLPDIPRDTFICRGFRGQRIFIIPSRSLVVVRLGISPENTFDFNGFLVSILDELPAVGL